MVVWYHGQCRNEPNRAQERFMPYHAFYACESSGKVVDSPEAQPIDLPTAAQLALEILCEDGDFFGLVDDADTTLQFLHTGEDIWMEIPVPAEQGSYGKDISLEEVPAMIESLPEQLSREHFSGFWFLAWE